MTQRRKTLAIIGFLLLSIAAFMPTSGYFAVFASLTVALLTFMIFFGIPTLLGYLLFRATMNIFGPDANKTSAEIASESSDTGA